MGQKAREERVSKFMPRFFFHKAEYMHVYKGISMYDHS